MVVIAESMSSKQIFTADFNQRGPLNIMHLNECVCSHAVTFAHTKYSQQISFSFYEISLGEVERYDNSFARTYTKGTSAMQPQDESI